MTLETTLANIHTRGINTLIPFCIIDHADWTNAELLQTNQIICTRTVTFSSGHIEY